MRDDNVRAFPSPKKKDRFLEAKNFFNKPMHDSTHADALILSVTTHVAIRVIEFTCEGWIQIGVMVVNKARRNKTRKA